MFASRLRDGSAECSPAHTMNERKRLCMKLCKAVRGVFYYGISWNCNSKDGLVITDLNFTNRYEAAPVEVSFSGRKTLEGRTLAAEEFSFTLSGNGTTQTVKNKADGSITFSALTFDAPGIYSCSVKEEATTKAGVTIDSKVYHITVTVTDEGDGQLHAAISGDTATGTDLNFTNKYRTGSLSVSKTVSGNAASTTKGFNFTVELDDTTVNGTFGGTNGMTFTNGVASFTLKHGEVKTASDLPAGLGYTVSESGSTGYTVSASGEKDTIKADETMYAKFVNTRNDYGNGVIPKTGDGNNLLFWVLAVLTASAVAFVILFTGRRKKYSGKFAR